MSAALGDGPKKPVEEASEPAAPVDEEPKSDSVEKPVSEPVSEPDMNKLLDTLDIVDRPMTDRIEQVVPSTYGRDLSLTFLAGAVFGAGAVFLSFFIL